MGNPIVMKIIVQLGNLSRNRLEFTSLCFARDRVSPLDASWLWLWFWNLGGWFERHSDDGGVRCKLPHCTKAGLLILHFRDSDARNEGCLRYWLNVRKEKGFSLGFLPIPPIAIVRGGSRTLISCQPKQRVATDSCVKILIISLSNFFQYFQAEESNTLIWGWLHSQVNVGDSVSWKRRSWCLAQMLYL